MTPHPVPSRTYDPWRPADADAALAHFRDIMVRRRSVRTFSREHVDRRLIEGLIEIAGSAPSGANKQPWHFVAVGEPSLKRKIREAAEAEERRFYADRASPEWLKDLEPLGTDADKAFLEEAPWLIVVFKLVKDKREEALSDRVYYINESVGIAVGLLLAAAQQVGLATLTHTPSPRGFLGQLLDRPEYERPYLLIPIGWPRPGTEVPDIHRKKLADILTVHEGETS